jgi:hypothetical protein
MLFQSPSRLPLVFRSSPERSDTINVGYAQHIIRALALPTGGVIPLADCGRDQHTTLSENITVMSEAFEQCARGNALSPYHTCPRPATGQTASSTSRRVT